MEGRFCPRGWEKASLSPKIAAISRNSDIATPLLTTLRDGLASADSVMISDCFFAVTKRISMAKVSAVAPKNFEAAMAELDLLVEKMESGQLPLEESLSAYQRGAELIKYCEKVLSDAQQRIQVLDGGTGGNLKDFQQDSES
jgi:exodeoxyribonuclease VII small subunit